MDTRWTLSFDGGTTWPSVVVPQNGSKVRIVEERDLDAGQIFFRKKLNTALRFGKSDFDQFWNIERSASQRCNSILIRVELKCAFTWQEFWRGEFSTGSGKFNLDRCEFEVKPQVVDAYACILRKQAEKHNLLNTPVVLANVVALPAGFEVLVTQWPGPPFATPDTYGWAQVDTQSITYPSGMGLCTGNVATFEIYWRETVITDCIAGNPVQPAGDGWIELGPTEPNVSDPITCDDEGKTKWAREPLLTWPFPNDPVYTGPGVGVGETVSPPASPECGAWFRVGALECVGGRAAGLYLCLSEANLSVQLSHARRMDDALEYLLSQMDCDITSIRSDFFGIEPQGDAPGYVAGINYVTGLATHTEDILILQKSDAIDPDASNPATIGEMSFKDFMKALNVMFQVYWRIDNAGRLRIEHWNYWNFPLGLDLTAENDPIEPLAYQHQSGEVPRLERLTFMEALGRDFVGLDIIYSGPCADGAENEEKEYSPGKITTDLSYILSDPDAIAKPGFVFLATLPNGDEYDVVLDFGAISGSPTTNAPLATANLERDYWRNNRFLREANMNGVDTTFDTFLPNIEQEQASAAVCCGFLTFRADRRVTTELGARLGGLTGVVETAEYDLHVCRLYLKLRYAY